MHVFLNIQKFKFIYQLMPQEGIVFKTKNRNPLQLKRNQHPWKMSDSGCGTRNV